MSLRQTFASALAVDAAATTTAMGFAGGKTAVVMWLGAGGALPGTLKLQFVTSDGTFLDIFTFLAQGMTIMDLPKGKYRVSFAGGVPSHVNVTLETISYN